MDLRATQKELILNGNLTKIMWNLSLPAIVAMVLYGLNAFMDTVYIGQLMNETALSGVALAYPLTTITLGLGAWAGTGAGNLLSIALGDKNKKTERLLMSNATLLMLVSSFVFAIPAYYFAEELIVLMGGSGVMKMYGVTYLKTTLFVAPLWVYGLGLNFMVRAEGKMKKAAFMMTYGLVVNLILTPIFIKYGDFGVEGAAWATNIGMLIYCLVGYFYFKKGNTSFDANIHSLQYNKKVFFDILKMGFPGLIMSLMGLIQAIVVFNALSKYGTADDIAFFASANRILLFLMTPLFGLMRALQPVIGINYGAQQYKRVKNSLLLFTKTGFWFVFPFWLLLTIFPEQSLSLMLPKMTFGTNTLWYFRVYMAVIPFLPLVFMALTYFPAIENPKPASLLAIARQLVLYIPLMIFLPKWFGIKGIYYGATVIDILITLCIIQLLYKSFKTLHNKNITIEKRQLYSPKNTMKINKLLPLLITLLFLGACNSENEEPLPKFQLNKADNSIKWTAYKTTDKIPVNGSFTTINIISNSNGNTIKEAMNNLEFSIPITSLVSGVSKYNLINFFFGAMNNTNLLSGKIFLISDATGYVEITMNDIKENIPFTYAITNEKFTLSGTLDLTKWNTENAINSLNNICNLVHMGGDGIVKLWNDVEIKATSSFNK